MNYNYYTYKTFDFTCNKCKWQGKGSETKVGEIFEALFEIDCPKCHEPITHISHPSDEETLQYGTEEEKNKTREGIAIREAFEQSKLKYPSQLPEISDNGDLIFVVKPSKDGNYLEIYFGDRLIWKEDRWYEYYERFIEIGVIFKEKYGKQLVDFIPEGDDTYLYGDRYLAFGIVQKFRDSLKISS